MKLKNLKCKNNNQCFLKDNDYVVHSVLDDIILIQTGYVDYNQNLVISFSLSSYNRLANNRLYVWDYFYTEKELRKLKLKNINENG